MLRDRRVLLERELKLAKDAAAKCYLATVTAGGNLLDQQYELLRSRVEQIQFDLDMLNQLISEGHE